MNIARERKSPRDGVPSIRLILDSRSVPRNDKWALGTGQMENARKRNAHVFLVLRSRKQR
jgi:hypothetical protein